MKSIEPDTLNPGTVKAFEREVSVLKRLSTRHDPHVVKLLATFEQGESYHMILTWADGGTLRDLWSHYKQRPQLTKGLIASIMKQLVGLADALRLLHEYGRDSDGGKIYGKHGDIKPENILWFKPDDNGNLELEDVENDLGTLAISDFGLSEISKSADATSVRAWTPTYRPPEADLVGKASQASDMWAFGCVLIEFLVWMTAGWDGVEERFPSARTTVVDPHDTQSEQLLDDSFFTLDKGVPALKSAVSDVGVPHDILQHEILREERMLTRQ